MAISAAPRNGWGLAFASPDAESAKNEALERCSERSGQHVCKVYAVGTGVVWSAASLPLPMAADVHAEPLSIPLVAAEVPLLNNARRQEITEQIFRRGNPTRRSPSRGNAFTGTLRTAARKQRGLRSSDAATFSRALACWSRSMEC